MSARTRYMIAGALLATLALVVLAVTLDGYWDTAAIIAAWFYIGTQFPKLVAKDSEVKS